MTEVEIMLHEINTAKKDIDIAIVNLQSANCRANAVESLVLLGMIEDAAKLQDRLKLFQSSFNLQA